MIELATERIIDSVWTVVFERTGDGKAKILAYGRRIKEGYESERSLPRCRLLEHMGHHRIVRAIVLSPYDPFRDASEKHPGSEVLEVTNQAFVFGYGDHWGL